LARRQLNSHLRLFVLVELLEKPFNEQNLFATIFSALGLDPYAEYDVPDLPTFYRVEDRAEPIREILAESMVKEGQVWFLGLVTSRRGITASAVPGLEAGYDVAFFDGSTPVPALHKALRGLLKTGGVLITANLNHGGTAEAVHAALFDGESWQSSLADEDGETAISVKL